MIIQQLHSNVKKKKGENLLFAHTISHIEFSIAAVHLHVYHIWMLQCNPFWLLLTISLLSEGFFRLTYAHRSTAEHLALDHFPLNYERARPISIPIMRDDFYFSGILHNN